MTVFRLQRGETLLGLLYPRGREDPWVQCSFTPTPAFDGVRQLFAAELHLLRYPPGHHADPEVWERAYARVDALGLLIVPIDGGETIDDFLLHIDGPVAWLRY
jgi:hypothetical protein